MEETVKEIAKTEIKKQNHSRDNEIYVGDKSIMTYVNAVITQFEIKNFKEVILSGRGVFIKKCVDIEELITQRMQKDKIKVKTISLSSSEFLNEEKRNIRVSAIEITLFKV